MNKKLIVIFILVLAFGIRFWNVWATPAGLYYDEIDAGYHARSLIETFKDYRGNLSPFFANSFVDPRPPLPIYLTVLSTLLFSNPELEVRMGNVILGTINVLLIFILLWLWTKNYFISLIGLIVTATNPWWIQFSRFNHESHLSVFFPLLGIILFLTGLETKKFRYIILATISIALGVYTYRTMSVISPIIFACLFISYFHQLKSFSFKKVALLVSLFLLITLSMVTATTLFAQDKPRIAQIAIFVDPGLPIQIQRLREIDSGDISDFTIGKQATFLSSVFHNKLESFITAFFKNYYKTFSTEFLFVDGDKNHRHSIEGQGMLLYTDIIVLGFGIYFLFKNRKQQYALFILLLFFLTPVPSSLTQDGAAHGSRLFWFSVPLLITISFGWYFLYHSVTKIKFGNFIIFILIASHLSLFAFYLHDYHTHFKIDSARWFGYPYKEAMQILVSYEKDFDHIVLVPHPEPPNIYLLFWGNVPPLETQKFGSNFNEPKNDGSYLDRFKIVDLPPSTEELIKVMQPKTLYLVTQQELREDLREGKTPPLGIDLLDIITFPDKEIAFYLIKKSDILNP